MDFGDGGECGAGLGGEGDDLYPEINKETTFKVSRMVDNETNLSPSHPSTCPNCPTS